MVRRELDIYSHNFSTEDLAKMFDLGDAKEKALLALGASLGWEVSAALSLTRRVLQSYVDRAKSENRQFYYFIRKDLKTNVPRLGVLNPLALEWIEKWLIESKRLNAEKKKAEQASARSQRSL